MASPKSVFDFLDAPLEAGDLGTLGHYRVIAELGRGGMGYVFRARDKRLHRDVALKVMNQKVAAIPFSRKRFIREARAMAAVHHDNVATIFEVGENAGTPFMAMELLEGMTLEALNNGQQRMGYEQVIAYAKQISAGLAAAHAKGIVHRDIKPANIWLQPDRDRIKILDFGLALAATPVDQLAGRGAVIGTPGYLSPEQARTEPLDDRTDLYSLGVVLYELCTGCLPLQGGSVPGQLIAILAHRPQPLTEVNADIPSPLSDLIHRLLFKEPRARVASAVALGGELERVQQECHALSDVAQAINKLQQGLSEVVSKQSTEIAPVPLEFSEVLDPLQSIPDPPAAELSHPKLATVHPPAYLQQVARAQPKSAEHWQKYLPVVAIAAVVLIALPIMTFMFSGAGRSNQAVVIGQSESAGNAPTSRNDSAPRANPGGRQTVAGSNADRPRTNANSSPKPASSKANSDQQSNRNAANRNRQAQNRQRQNRQAPGGQRQNRQTAANPRQGNQPNNPAGRNPPNRNSTTDPKPELQVNRSGQPNSNRPPVQSTSSDAILASSTSRSATPPPDDAVEPAASKPELKTTRISTADGRGADTMVQIGTNSKLGTKPSIGVHRRGKIESHHSYLRFDLAAIEEVKQEVQSAELVLTLVGRERPDGGTLRLYAIPGQMPLWPEEGPMAPVWSNTPSRQGLESLPMLSSITLAATLDSPDQDPREVRIGGERFAAFLRESAEDTVNLILAGNGDADQPLRFVSREGAAGKAPALMIQAPAEPTVKKRNQRQSR